MKTTKTLFQRLVILTFACLLAAGCAGRAAYKEGQVLSQEGKIEEALGRFRTAADEDSGNAEYRTAYLKTRDQAVRAWLDQAASARLDGKEDEARTLYRRVVGIDPGNARAKSGIRDLERDVRHRDLLAQAEAAWAKKDPDTALSHLRAILTENPEHTKALQLQRTIEDKASQAPTESKLSRALKKPISIEFKDAPIRQVFEIMSRTSGLNFIFDKDVKGEQRTTIFLRSSTVENALNLLLFTNQMEQRVLDGNSILIYPNTAAKIKDYQPLTVKTFFLANGDVKTAANTIKTITKTKDLIVDERQNMIIMRDTPDAVRMAEKLLALHDLPEPEVMLEVEILEVNYSRLMALGVQWPDQLTLAPLAGTGGSVTLADIKSLNSDKIGATLTPMTINVKKQDTDTKILANPRIRARNKETAKILIGEKVPNITVTTTATGFASENIQYVDIGLKLEVQPTIYLDNEVAIKIALEVSSIISKIQTKSGALAFEIGTRNASTVLRLRDGENQVLAGLINHEDSSTGNRVPGLGDIPILGRLFGSQSDDKKKTEIVLSITPRLVRNIRRPDSAFSEFDSGTESSLKTRIFEAGTAGAPSPSQAPGNNTIQVSGPPQPTEAAPISGGATIEGSPSASLAWLGPQQAKAGSAFTVQLQIQPDQKVTSVPLAIAYDPKLLEVTGISEGNFLKQGGGVTNFSNRVDKGSGQAFVTITRAGAGGAANPGNLMNISFRALTPSPEARVQLTTIAPIGLEGRSVSAPLPSPYTVTITP